MQFVAANARGEDRTLTTFYGQGILSRSSTPNIRRQRGQSATAERTEAHTHPIPSYHECYHGSRQSPTDLIYSPKEDGSLSNALLIWKVLA